MVLVVMQVVPLTCHRCPLWKNARKDNTGEEFTGRRWSRFAEHWSQRITNLASLLAGRVPSRLRVLLR
jgi:hypothetical protein